MRDPGYVLRAEDWNGVLKRLNVLEASIPKNGIQNGAITTGRGVRSNSLDIVRGKLQGTLTSSSNPNLRVQTWDADTNAWVDGTSDDDVDVRSALPFSGSVAASKIAWAVRVFGQYFVFLAECT
jgi:hypothetical protein